jgi:hypothetical protein
MGACMDSKFQIKTVTGNRESGIRNPESGIYYANSRSDS